MLKRVRDFAQVKNDGVITDEIADMALNSLEVDKIGLDNNDIRYIENIIKKFAGGPVGLDTIASVIGEDVDTVEDVIEPYLMQIGFVNRTPRGRSVTPAAYNHLKIPFVENKKATNDNQETIF